MASSTYRLFNQAIHERRQVICRYQDCIREVCPHILGHNKNGQEMALVFQFAGESNTYLPPGGEWRCLALTDVREARMRSGRWHTGPYHRTTQSCVDTVAVDVNMPDTRR